MKNYILFITFSTFMFFGCSSSAPEDVNQNNDVDDLAVVVEVVEDSVVEGNIYKNNLYGFQFVILEGANLNTDKRSSGVEDYDPLYYVSIHLKDSINTNLHVYHKEPRLRDVESTYTKYKKLESFKGQDVEVWESGPSQGAGNWWFLSTYFFGEKYAIKIETSNADQSEDFFEKHDELMNSFEFLEGY